MKMPLPRSKRSGRSLALRTFCIGLTLGNSCLIFGSNPSEASPVHASSEFQGVSCPAARFCVAVGTSSPDEYGQTMSTLTAILRGKSWSIRNVPRVGSWSGLFGVSCPAVRFCVAVGYGSIGKVANTEVAQKTLIETYNDRSWSVVPSANPGLSSNKVKPCSSPTAVICETVHPPADGADRLSGVACASRSDCVAVGQSMSVADYPKGQPLIETYHGSKWSAAASPTVPSGGDLQGVSCTGLRFCVAVGSSGSATLVEVFDGKSWSIVPSPNETTPFYSVLSAVSCTSAISCHAVGYSYVSKSAGEAPFAESYTGTGWTLDTLGSPPGGGQLNGISCVTSNSCVAVGVSFPEPDGASLAYTRNGNAWTLSPSAAIAQTSQPGLTAVSCVSAHSCAAVGSHYGASSNVLTTTEVFNGQRWSLLPSRNVTATIDSASRSPAPEGRS